MRFCWPRLFETGQTWKSIGSPRYGLYLRLNVENRMWRTGEPVYRKYWSSLLDSNQWPLPCQGNALPTALRDECGYSHVILRTTIQRECWLYKSLQRLCAQSAKKERRWFDSKTRSVMALNLRQLFSNFRPSTWLNIHPANSTFDWVSFWELL